MQLRCEVRGARCEGNQGIIHIFRVVSLSFCLELSYKSVCTLVSKMHYGTFC